MDLITGDVTGPAADRDGFRNESTKVVARFTPSSWERSGDVVTVRTTLTAARDMYLRVRGTSGADLEPSMDEIGEDPWSDLWFYSNPVFIHVPGAPPDRR
ncbi:MAG: hypothetical protein R2712_11375 [Vicinamibacterales bacterium]